MSESREPIRSYQRIFRPERRIYQIEGRTLPVPGGVPLRWLGYADRDAARGAGARLGLGRRRSPGARAAAPAGRTGGGRGGRALAGRRRLRAASWLGGLALGLLDWPLRLDRGPGRGGDAGDAGDAGRPPRRPLRRSPGSRCGWRPAGARSGGRCRRPARPRLLGGAALGRARRARSRAAPRPGPRAGDRRLRRRRSTVRRAGLRRRRLSRARGLERRRAAGRRWRGGSLVSYGEALEVRP